MAGAYDVVVGGAGVVCASWAFGVSGHGFRPAPAVGQGLARMVTGRPHDFDIDPCRHTRLAAGAPLTGACGIGPIS